jgi:hypothetical protein
MFFISFALVVEKPQKGFFCMCFTKIIIIKIYFATQSGRGRDKKYFINVANYKNHLVDH